MEKYTLVGEIVAGILYLLMGAQLYRFHPIATDPGSTPGGDIAFVGAELPGL